MFLIQISSQFGIGFLLALILLQQLTLQILKQFVDLTLKIATLLVLINLLLK